MLLGGWILKHIAAIEKLALEYDLWARCLFILDIFYFVDG